MKTDFISEEAIFMSKTISDTRRLIYASACVALGVVLPMAFHAIPNAGSIFLPMHIPVLICGLLCGPFYGLACGILAPLISALTTGMPPMAMLPSMVCELAVYGCVGGLMIRALHPKSCYIRILCSLVIAMLCGRIAGGILNALIFRAGQYSLQMWLTGSFAAGLPGIAIQIVVIPLIVLALRKASLIPASGWSVG